MRIKIATLNRIIKEELQKALLEHNTPTKNNCDPNTHYEMPDGQCVPVAKGDDPLKHVRAKFGAVPQEIEIHDIDPRVKNKLMQAYTTGENRRVWEKKLKRDNPRMPKWKIKQEYEGSMLKSVERVLNTIKIRKIPPSLDKESWVPKNATGWYTNYNPEGPGVPEDTPIGLITVRWPHWDNMRLLAHEVGHAIDANLHNAPKTDTWASYTQHDLMRQAFPDAISSKEARAHVRTSKKSPEHSKLGVEIYTDLINLRAMINRPYTCADIEQLVNPTSAGQKAGLSYNLIRRYRDLRKALTRQYTSRPDQPRRLQRNPAFQPLTCDELANTLNQIAVVDIKTPSRQTALAESTLKQLIKEELLDILREI